MYRLGCLLILCVCHCMIFYGQTKIVDIEEMRTRFGQYKTMEDSVSPMPKYDVINWSSLIYPVPLNLSRTEAGQCFWSIKNIGKNWSSPDNRRYLRLDSIAGMSYDSWPDEIKEGYRYDDKDEGEVYAKAVTGTFYSFEPLYYMGWWVSNFYTKLLVEKGKVKIENQITSGKARDIAFDKGYSRLLGNVGIRNYEPEFSVVLTDYVNQVEKESRIEQKNPRIYDFLVVETDGGYDLEVLACSSEAGQEWKELRQKIRELPKGFFTPLYTLGGVKLPGLYLEGRYERAEDGRNWKFSIQKYFANKGAHIIGGE